MLDATVGPGGVSPTLVPKRPLSRDKTYPGTEPCTLDRSLRIRMSPTATVKAIYAATTVANLFLMAQETWDLVVQRWP